MSPLFSSHKVQSSYGRKRWILLLAVLVGIGVSYKSLRELHGMVEYEHGGGVMDHFHGFEERHGDDGHLDGGGIGGLEGAKEDMGGAMEEEHKETEHGDTRDEGLREEKKATAIGGEVAGDANTDDTSDGLVGEDEGRVEEKQQRRPERDVDSEDDDAPASSASTSGTTVTTSKKDEENEENEDQEAEEGEERNKRSKGDADGMEHEEEEKDVDSGVEHDEDQEESKDKDTAGHDDSSVNEEESLDCKDIIVKKNTDFWGDPLVWGTENLVDSEDECCKMCAEHKPKKGGPACNVWVYCGVENLCRANYRQCWLKHLTHPDGAMPAAEGPMVGWTTGIMKKPRASVASQHHGEDRTYHIVVSAQGTATHWQSRIHYYWYKKIKKQCEAEGHCDMGDFTRLLHSGKPDDLMDEIPTFVAKELPPEHPHHGYIVLNRPYAFLQWMEKATIKEKYILMGEPDHLWLKPMPNLMDGENPAAFPFFYIEPTSPKYIHITEKFVGKIDTPEQKARLFPIGSSPTLLSVKDMNKIAPIWYNVSLAVHEDDEAAKEWGWVQEMYAFTISMYLAGIKECGLFLDMMAQPPWDSQKDRYYILHYTYGMDYAKNGTFTPGKYGEWRFDKRSYSTTPLPRNLDPPPDGVQNDSCTPFD
eukprot:jgi/Picre1/34363/NNA_001834.t1